MSMSEDSPANELEPQKLDRALVPATTLVDAEGPDAASVETMPRNERIIFACRQAAIVGVPLLFASAVTERLRPDEALERNVISTPFLWAIVIWLIALLFHAAAFEQSQVRDLEREPMIAAAVIAAVLFFTGLVTFDAGDGLRRILYLAANSLGAMAFWWGLISLGLLVVKRLRD